MPRFVLSALREQPGSICGEGPSLGAYAKISILKFINGAFMKISVLQFINGAFINGAFRISYVAASSMAPS